MGVGVGVEFLIFCGWQLAHDLNVVSLSKENQDVNMDDPINALKKQIQKGEGILIIC